MNEHRRIVIVGKGASGKDYAKTKFKDKGFTVGISYTTRPPRDNERDGVDYHFVTREEFMKRAEADQFYEWVEFNGWCYGTDREQFFSRDVFIMTPDGISRILPEDRKRTMIIYLDIPYEVRRERLNKRSDADSADRRLWADDQDFALFTDFDIRIDNPNY